MKHDLVILNFRPPSAVLVFVSNLRVFMPDRNWLVTNVWYKCGTSFQVTMFSLILVNEMYL